jgi:hypothetical protein
MNCPLFFIVSLTFSGKENDELTTLWMSMEMLMWNSIYTKVIFADLIVSVIKRTNCQFRLKAKIRKHEKNAKKKLDIKVIMSPSLDVM